MEELSNNEARRDELDALFAEVNELEEGEFDEENYEVFPKEIIKEHKANIKEINGSIKGLKKEIKALNIRIKANDGDAALTAEVEEKESEVTLLTKQKTEIENKLARHAELEQELKTCKATIKEIKDKKDDLVEKAREKITPDEAKELILTRWKATLAANVMDYVNRYERAFIIELENRFVKYQHTLTSVLHEREEAANELSHFLTELGYEG